MTFKPSLKTEVEKAQMAIDDAIEAMSVLDNAIACGFLKDEHSLGNEEADRLAEEEGLSQEEEETTLVDVPDEEEKFIDINYKFFDLER